MERARLRKSKSASGFEGLHQIQKHKNVSRLAPDSHSYINGSTRDNMFMAEMGQSSSVRAVERERPMAKLLEGKIEPKRRSLNGITRLMRIEAPHSLWHIHRPKKRLSDNYRRNNNVSINMESSRKLYDGRRSPMKQQEFNDVYDEDLEFVYPRCSSRWSMSSMLSESEMELIQLKLDAKHLSDDDTSDEKLEDSKKLDDALDMLDFNDLLMRFVRKPDSLFENKRVNPSSSVGCRRAVLKPSSSAKYEGNEKAWIRDIDTIGGYDIRDDGLLFEPRNRSRAHKISDIQLEERKKKKNMLPTPIVVLRPNLGNMQNAALCGSSSCHSHGYIPNFRQMKEHPSVGGVKELSSTRKDSYYDVESSKLSSSEARKLDREITLRIRDAWDESEESTYFRLGKYIVDESSYDARRSDIKSESEMFKLASRNSSVDDGKWGRHPFSTFVNGEGRKRLLERWKITQRYQDLKIVGKGITLGEMLAIPDGETRSKKNYDYKRNDRSSTRLGIQKNEIQGTSTRSKSLPPLGGRIDRRGKCHDLFTEEKCMMHSDPISCCRSKNATGYSNHKDFLSSQGSKSRSKKPLSCPPIYIKEMDYSLEDSFEIKMEANVKDFPEQQLMFQMAEKDDCKSTVSDIVFAEQGIKTSLLHPKHSSVENESSAAHDQEDFCLQGLHQESREEDSPSLHCLGAEPLSPESSKDADSASPVSVFEVPIVEDASSSSESFERVSAELNELRKRLQLLKMESCGAYDETSTLIIIAKDIAYPSSRAEGWELSYALDVLINSGIQDFDFDMFRTMWNFPDCPLNPGLFDDLEKKYSDAMTGLRSERMLLFERINSALSEIFMKHVDLRPWVRPKLAGLLSTSQKKLDKDALEKLIDQESQVTERILDREMQWADPTEEIVLMVNEIEELLIDDIITEFLCNYWC